LKSTLRGNGLPAGVALFYRHPLVWLNDSVVAAASPRAVREQLRGALWGRHLAQAKKGFGDNGAEKWTMAFGDLFEAWCRQVARDAEEGAHFRGQLFLSDGIGDDGEVEDVVIVDGRRAALFAVKSSTIPESHLRWAASAADALAWYDRFFFGQAGSGAGRRRRGGAIRLLDEKVNRVRRGEYATRGVTPRMKLYPVIVVYDEIGADLPSLYVWLQGRCNVERLLQHSRLAGAVVLHVDDYEQLMAAAAEGLNVLDLLDKKSREPWRRGRMAVLLRQEWRRGSLRRPGVEDRYEDLAERIHRRLFPDSERSIREHLETVRADKRRSRDRGDGGAP
jgi:hypothetical protein